MHMKASFFDNSVAITGEILTESLIPNSLRAAPTFAFFHGKQLNMNSSCDQSYFAENWQKSSRSDKYKSNSYKRDLSEEDNNISSGIVEISRSCFHSSTTNNMRDGSSPSKDNFVYKRRQMQRNAVALLSDKNTDEITEENVLSDFNLSSSDCHLSPNEDSFDEVQEAADQSTNGPDNGKPSFSGRHHLDVQITSNSSIMDQNIQESAKDVATNKKISYSAELLTKKLCSTSNLTVSREQTGDGNVSRALSFEYLEKFETLEEMCIYVLKMHGLLGINSRNGSCPPSENMGSSEPLFPQCKICHLSESSLKMLICDDCEEAYHLSCCRPKIKKLPSDEWYCQSCFTKKRKHLLEKSVTSSADVDYISESGGLIATMASDYYPHRSRVRVGDDFQAKVPDWLDPISNGDNYFGEPKKMDHADSYSMGGWNLFKSSKSNSIGNWLQCKEGDGKGKICGKWRRAPLFSVQTDEWDCSCALPWDPIHADCAVPQELETEMIFKHLKYVEMLRSRLNNRTKPV